MPQIPHKREATPHGHTSPLTQRQKSAAAADLAEETTIVEVPGSRQDWLAPLHDMYSNRELHDVVLTVGDQSLFAHRVALAMVSNVWRAEFGRSGMAESKSKEVGVEDVSFDALKAIVEYAYEGQVELGGEFFSSRRRPRSRSTSRPVLGGTEGAGVPWYYWVLGARGAAAQKTKSGTKFSATMN